MELQKLVGLKIVQARKYKSISQQDTADAIHISRTYLSDIEHGRYMPSVRVLTKIANYLDIDLNFLQCNDGNTSTKRKDKDNDI